MRAADTNVVVRILVRDHAAQVATADRFIAEGVWVSLVALLETTWVLERVYGRTETDVGNAIEMLLRHATLTLQSSEAVAEALQLFQKDPALGFEDCLILALARSEGHEPLGTFDRRLGKLEGAQTLR